MLNVRKTKIVMTIILTLFTVASREAINATADVLWIMEEGTQNFWTEMGQSMTRKVVGNVRQTSDRNLNCILAGGVL
jgi:hypothetical protein